MTTPINMHSARMALNHDAELRQWAEQWLKNKERAAVEEQGMSEAEFDKHWLYVQPERMHEGALEAVAAYRQRSEQH